MPKVKDKLNVSYYGRLDEYTNLKYNACDYALDTSFEQMLKRHDEIMDKARIKMINAFNEQLRLKMMATFRQIKDFDKRLKDIGKKLTEYEAKMTMEK